MFIEYILQRMEQLMYLEMKGWGNEKNEEIEY